MPDEVRALAPEAAGYVVDMIALLAEDAAIAPQIWNECVTRERYADFVLVNLLALLEQKMDSIDFFLDLVRATLYR